MRLFNLRDLFSQLQKGGAMQHSCCWVGGALFCILRCRIGGGRAFFAKWGGLFVLTAVFIVETESFKDSSSTWTSCCLGAWGHCHLVPSIMHHLQPVQMIASSHWCFLHIPSGIPVGILSMLPCHWFKPLRNDGAFMSLSMATAPLSLLFHMILQTLRLSGCDMFWTDFCPPSGTGWTFCWSDEEWTWWHRVMRGWHPCGNDQVTQIPTFW